MDDGVILRAAMGVFGKRVAAADDAFLRPWGKAFLRVRSAMH
jgi:hypothetical protein